MKKVIIVSYYTKPSNFVGSERIQAWLDYLPKEKIYPILITRFWEENQENTSASKHNKDNIIEKNGVYEIHRVAVKAGIRDYLIKENKCILLRKMLSLLNILLNNLWFKQSEYFHFHRSIDNILMKEKDIQTVIISGSPFHSFAIGYHIKNKYSEINWYPDYRDQWNTHPFKSKSGIINGLLFQLERRNEKKWTSNAKAFITVSENWRDRIFEFIKKPGYVVKNGYDLDILAIQEQTVPRNKNKLVISYIGTIYPYQNYKLFLEVIGELILENSFNIELNFIGIDSFYKISPDIKKRTMKFSKCVNIIERIPKNELKAIYKKSDLLWLTSFGKMKGWYPVKLFEYASQGIPILLYPTDNDDMEEFIKTTSSGFVFIEKEELKKWLVSIFNSESSININLNKGNLAKYSRRFQTNELAKIIK